MASDEKIGELVMSERDFTIFLNALDSDEEPSEKLRELFDDTSG